MKEMMALVLLALAPTVVCGAPAASRSVAEAEAVRLSVEMLKPTYMELEPVTCLISLTNLRKEPRRLAERRMRVEVTPLSVEGPVPARMSFCGPAPDIDSGWSFSAGEQRGHVSDLSAAFESPLPAGVWRVSVVYAPEVSIVNAWHGVIRAPDIQFIVHSASGPLAGKVVALRRLLKDAGHAETAMAAADALKAFESPEASGAFADVAGYHRAMALNVAHDSAGFVQAMRAYLATHSSVPCYGEQGRWDLADYLMIIRDYRGALAEFQKLPPSYQRDTEIAAAQRLADMTK